ncbi:MAG TPA: acyloxyacyl hydrolase [Terracidiphilus sp.]|nr:acyloxyacyl hydrolase [Terracidiphilus sp.]
MNRIVKLLILFLAAGTLATLPAWAQTASHSDEPAESPVAQVRNLQSWEFGPFVNVGNGFGNRDRYHFLALGVQAGKILTPMLHVGGHLSGQLEYGFNLMPFWQAYTPAPYTATVTTPGGQFLEHYGGGTFTGVSLTPVILRWNFATRTRRFQPWFQAAGGLIYTTHKFPPNLLVVHGSPGGTSVFNFSPQGGGGFHYFLRPGRSIDLGVNAMHISSASLGDKNPGVNASIQVQIGYTFWK